MLKTETRTKTRSSRFHKTTIREQKRGISAGLARSDGTPTQTQSNTLKSRPQDRPC